MTTMIPTERVSVPRQRTEATVRWSHALPLVVVLAFANGFWLVALRGAVGSIARTSDPFTTWLRESALLVPWYAVAVVGAFALVLWRVGARPRGPARVAGAGALVAATGTLAGTLVLVLSSVLDYRLQVVDLQHMAAVHAGCDQGCLTERIQASAHLQVESVLVGAALMALTDLVVVALVIAYRGGRLEVAGSRAAGAGSLAGARALLPSLLLGAAAIHAAVVPEHLVEWRAAGIFLALLALAEAAAAVAVVGLPPRVAPSRPALAVAAAVSVVPLLVWTASRTAGLPFGPGAGTPEPVGVADVLADVLEVAALALALVLWLRLHRGRAAPRPWPPHAAALAICGALAATTLGVGASSLPGFSYLPDTLQHGAVDGVGGGAR